VLPAWVREPDVRSAELLEAAAGVAAMAVEGRTRALAASIVEFVGQEPTNPTLDRRVCASDADRKALTATAR